MKTNPFFALLTAALILGSLNASADDKKKDHPGKGKPEQKESDKGKSKGKHEEKEDHGKEATAKGTPHLVVSPGSVKAWTEGELKVLQDYLLAHPTAVPAQPAPTQDVKNLPPGLQKKLARGGQLPPGWQKKLQAGQVLEVPVYEHRVPLPTEVVIQLPPFPGDTEIFRVEDKIVRVLKKTREILDVLGIEH